MGTAFAVDARGLFLTAKHVLSDERFLGDASAGQLYNGTYYLLYPVPKDGKIQYQGLPIAHIGYSSRVDIALMRVGLPERPYRGDWARCLPVQKVQLGLPKIGERCIAIGFTEIGANSPELIYLRLQRAVLTGRIEQIYYPFRDKSMLHSPTIAIDCELLSGMSGGPIISADSGNILGVISSGGLLGVSFASLIHRAMCLPTGDQELDGRKELLWARVNGGTVVADVSGFRSEYDGVKIKSQIFLKDIERISFRMDAEFQVNSAGWATQWENVGEANQARVDFVN